MIDVDPGSAEVTPEQQGWSLQTQMTTHFQVARAAASL